MIRLIAATSLLLAVSLAVARPAAAEGAPATPIGLRTTVLVEGDVLRLGDLFDGLGEQAGTAIARAPAPGHQVELSGQWLRALAQGFGLDWRPIPGQDRALVRRVSQVIDAASVEEELLATLGRRGGTGELSVLLDNPSIALHLPVSADPSLAVTGFRHDPTTGRFKALVVAPATGTALARATVTGRAIELVELPVLARRLGSAQIIAASDLEWLRMPANRVAANVARDPEELIGKSPRRAIRPGQPVRVSDLREPVLVPKNSLVLLRLETDRMTLTVQGRALEDGAAGEVVRVMNTKSNTAVQGLVAEAGIVRVTQIPMN